MRAAARRMGYRPNRTAQALATGKTHTVGLWMTWIHTAHYARIADTMQQLAAQHGYDTLISKRMWTGLPAGRGRAVAALPSDGVFAVDVGVPRQAAELRRLRQAMRPGEPLVSLGAFWLEDVDHVGVDLYPARRQAIERLLRTGRRRIAYVEDEGSHADTRTDARGFAQHDKAYVEAMAEAGRATEYVLVPDQSRSTVCQAVRKHVAAQGCPDALLCHNDDMAIGAMRALRELGRRVPEDVAVIGCDGIEDGEYQAPALATIVQPVAEMCERAWHFMEQRLAEPSAPAQQAILTAQFIPRESAGATASE